MRHATAKFLKAYASLHELNIKDVKRAWQALPWNKRHAYRVSMEKTINEIPTDVNGLEQIAKE